MPPAALSSAGFFVGAETPIPVAWASPEGALQSAPVVFFLYFFLFFSVSGSSAFRKQCQLVVLYFGSIPPCKSPVFFSNFFSAGLLVGKALLTQAEDFIRVSKPGKTYVRNTASISVMIASATIAQAATVAT